MRRTHKTKYLAHARALDGWALRGQILPNWVIITFLAILFISAIIPAAHASAQCGSRSAIIQVLEKKYLEGRVAVGLSQTNTQAYEVFVSEKGSWTLMMTNTNGATCIMAAGHSWQKVDEAVKLGQES